MMKDNSKNCNQQNNDCEQVQQNNGCNHVQLGGVAFYDERKCFLFTPDQQGVRDQVPGFRSQGVAQHCSSILVLILAAHLLESDVAFHHLSVLTFLTLYSERLALLHHSHNLSIHII